MPPTPEPEYKFTAAQEEKLADAMGLPPQKINTVWGQSKLGHRVFVTLPSGQTCWASVIGLQGVLEAGVMGEADSLTAFVGKQFVRKVRGGKGQDGEQIDPVKLMGDTKALQKILRMVDGLTPFVVSEPKVYCHYRIDPDSKDPENNTIMIPEEERRPGAIYTDMIGLEDKMFLFNFAMSGVQNAESFRAESASAVGDVADGEGVSPATERPNGTRSERRARPRRRR